MGTGILLCGLNGAGKSTLGKALAEKLGFYFLDHEDLYFSKIEPKNPYAFPLTKPEAKKRLLREIAAHENIVVTAVNGDFGDDVLPYFKFTVLLDTPKAIRMQRIRERSFRKFGRRMLPGGDLHEQERRFSDLPRLGRRMKLGNGRASPPAPSYDSTARNRPRKMWNF